MPFGFGLTNKTTRIALHAKFWLSPGNSEAHKNYSQLPNLSQLSAEVKIGGRDKNGQAKSLVPNQSLVSSICYARLYWQQQTSFVQEKSDHMIKAGIYENPHSIK